MSSGFLVRWPDTDLESRLKALAAGSRRSLHAEVLVALERHVALALPAVAPEAVSPGRAFEVASRDAPAGLPSAAQVAKRPFKSDFK